MHHIYCTCGTKMIIMFRVGTPQLFLLKIEYNGAWMTWNLHNRSNISRSSVVINETSLVYIYQLELDRFTKMINMVRVGIPPPTFSKIAKILKYIFNIFSKLKKIDKKLILMYVNIFFVRPLFTWVNSFI